MSIGPLYAPAWRRPLRAAMNVRGCAVRVERDARGGLSGTLSRRVPAGVRPSSLFRAGPEPERDRFDRGLGLGGAATTAARASIAAARTGARTRFDEPRRRAHPAGRRRTVETPRDRGQRT